MELCSSMAAALCFALACNLDTLLLAVVCGGRGLQISLLHALVLAVETTAVTALSLLLGSAFSTVLPVRTTEALGGLVLIGIGLWTLLDALQGQETAGEDQPPGPALRDWIGLAAALAVNNAGAGVAAGAAGLSLPLATVGTFLVTLTVLPLGERLGRRAAGRLSDRLALPLSGLLLLLLGLWEVIL
ncbi:manganese efflux pump MntP family protein [Pseudoflavonifractor sp. MSJ-37]|uniref:manganese efflux pump MntP family protein n=1 Tax=Pseudoflavonifractor sp. MSJ-37 TaxID=2841531 RepID=UPI001C0FA34B|nr:manganese efflux pump MntP family protein [Pseudoflavonifractor sp. MSJ-37]MBU5436079.1 manganese efflux pump MntP family protein [Pseudoflavonifractor sp. MSJ-37]